MQECHVCGAIKPSHNRVHYITFCFHYLLGPWEQWSWA